ncbi:uncharacterized protein PHACADRAFT_251516 [Phanerochaete carnosa HHB-10118-sp]|uniref:Uncharacterized protein n=1 Tax=Phanerochaete carnosa (strain HHB-10118-sp) TaxID=650164 RepID=K5WF55_PHACS|nr:uncharacterized protein PHACADRAFT_251516 [Phanerochaete carnosa HHB-10118-sp]EKM57714.1 hypothetical protein PHACADRAFT_251516 [Phanerochaete carnosa HHB-10118-sp]
MSQILPTTAYLLLMVVETLIYGAPVTPWSFVNAESQVCLGMYIVLFILSMYFLVGGGRNRKLRGARANMSTILTIIVNVLLLVIITAHWVIAIVEGFGGFTGQTSSEPEGRLLYFSAVSGNWQAITLLALYLAGTAVADYVMVYRLFAVWQRKWPVVTLPICLYLSVLVNGAMFIYNFHKLTSDEDIFKSSFAPWLASTLTCSAATNVYCSTLLSYKVWSAQRALRRARTTQLRSAVASKILAIIIESASLFTASSIIITTTYFCHSYAAFTCVCIAPPLIGLAYCLVIVRFGIHGAFKTDNPVLSTIELPSLQPSYSI